MKKLIFVFAVFIVSELFGAVAGTPVLRFPNDRETKLPTAFSVAWSGTANDTVYHVQVGVISTFSSTIVNDSTVVTASRALSGLSNGITYFWRVRARGTTGGWSPYAATRRFTVISSTTPILLVYPKAISYNQSLSSTSYSGSDRDSVYIGGTRESPVVLSVARFGTTDTLKCVFMNDTTNVRFFLAGTMVAATFKCYVPFIRMKTTGGAIIRQIMQVETP